MKMKFTLRSRLKAAWAAFRNPFKVEDGVILQQMCWHLWRTRGMAIMTAENGELGLLPKFTMLPYKEQHEISRHLGIALP